MMWFTKVVSWLKKAWADIEKYVKIAFAIIVILFGARLFFGGPTSKDKFQEKVEEAKKKNEEVKKKADEAVKSATDTMQDVQKSTDAVKSRKEDRDKKADDIFGGG